MRAAAKNERRPSRAPPPSRAESARDERQAVFVDYCSLSASARSRVCAGTRRLQPAGLIWCYCVFPDQVLVCTRRQIDQEITLRKKEDAEIK